MTNPDELERLARAATPGPWQNGFDDLEGVVSLGAKDDGNVVCLPPASFMELSQVRWDDNAAFIAAANPATILALLSANREMRTATPDLTAVIAWLKNGCDPAHAVTELQIYQDRLARSALTTQRGDGE